MLAWFKAWQARHNEAKLAKAIAFCERQRPEMFQRFVADRATELAARILMDMLDKEGMRHCWSCPSRDQLRQFEGKFFCPQHFLIARANAVARDSAKTALAVVALMVMLVGACRPQPKENRLMLVVDFPKGSAYEPVGKVMEHAMYNADNNLEREYSTSVKVKPQDAADKIYVVTLAIELKEKPKP